MRGNGASCYATEYGPDFKKPPVRAIFRIGCEDRSARTHEAAFALVEIMIVVAIISLLASIAMPSFMQARRESQLNVCLNNLRTYQHALEQYVFPNKQYPDDINDLVTQRYLAKSYQCPAGGAYNWSVSSGNHKYHLICDGQHTPSINHVCIHEDQVPTAK